MNIVNRNQFNDMMFEELAQFAQHQIVTSPYRHVVSLETDAQEDPVAILEDVRMVFNTPGEVQIKARIATASVDKILKTDKVGVIVDPIAPNPEPKTIYDVTEWFEELTGLVDGIENLEEVYLHHNRWIFLRAKRR